MNDEIRWQGPFSFLPRQTAPWAFEQSRTDFPGIYLWTVEQEGEFLVNYVGITKKAVSWRLQEHVEAYLSGQYKVYDPDRFVTGTKQAVYVPTGSVLDFVSRYGELAPQIFALLGAFRVFASPLEQNIDWMRRVETGIILALRGASDVVVRTFLDNERVSNGDLKTDRHVVRMSHSGDVRIRGLGSHISA
jgi:hypothetical protein